LQLRNLLAICVLLSLSANCAYAWPRLFRSKQTVNQEQGGDNSTAQGVALIQANRCRLGHCGGFSGYEGVGRGDTADIAIANCCFWGKRVPAEIGVALGADNKYYACVRYH
jgi:hypothetical protein